MTCTPPRSAGSSDPHQIAFERRKQAAWFDYLASVQDAPRRSYDEIERAAWERLQRRLERNEERLEMTRPRSEFSSAHERL